MHLIWAEKKIKSFAGKKLGGKNSVNKLVIQVNIVNILNEHMIFPWILPKYWQPVDGARKIVNIVCEYICQ